MRKRKSWPRSDELLDGVKKEVTIIQDKPCTIYCNKVPGQRSSDDVRGFLSWSCAPRLYKIITWLYINEKIAYLGWAWANSGRVSAAHQVLKPAYLYAWYNNKCFPEKINFNNLILENQQHDPINKTLPSRPPNLPSVDRQLRRQRGVLAR